MDSTQPNRNSGALVGASILIVSGVIALIANLGGSEYVYRSIPLAIGAAFLVAYALTRQYGFLVPGGILSGIGAGTLMAAFNGGPDEGLYVVLALGLGFLLVFAVDMLVTRTMARWWPLIPGGVMLVVGVTAGESAGSLWYAHIWLPVLLIAFGVLLLIARMREPSR